MTYEQIVTATPQQLAVFVSSQPGWDAEEHNNNGVWHVSLHSINKKGSIYSASADRWTAWSSVVLTMLFIDGNLA